MDIYIWGRLNTSDVSTDFLCRIVAINQMADKMQLSLFHLHLAPPLGFTQLNFTKIFGTRKLEFLGYCVALVV